MKVANTGITSAFYGDHYDQPNIAVHIRYDIRETEELGKVLFVNEIQSDWAQSLRDQKVNAKEQGPLLDKLSKWTRLGVRFAIEHAKRRGINYVSWATGEDIAVAVGAAAHKLESYYGTESEMGLIGSIFKKTTGSNPFPSPLRTETHYDKALGEVVVNSYNRWVVEIGEKTKGDQPFFSSAVNIPLNSPVNNTNDTSFDIKSWSTLLNQSDGAAITKQDVLVALAKVDKLDPKDKGRTMREIVNLWKRYYIRANIGKLGMFNKKELNSITATKHITSLVETYEKELNYLEKIVSNSNFRNALAKTPSLRILASRRAGRLMRGNPAFYINLRRLSRVNPSIFKTQEELEEFNSLLSARPESVNVSNYIDKVNEIYSAYIESKKNASATAVQSEEDLREKEQQTEHRRTFAKFASQYYAEVFSDDKDIVEFASYDLDNLTPEDLRQYIRALKYIGRNGAIDDYDAHRLSMKLKANEFMERYIEEVDGVHLDWFNRKTARLRVVDTFLSKNGNIKRYSLKEHLAFLEGMSEEYNGILSEHLFKPLESTHDKQRKIMRQILTDLNPPKKLASLDQQNFIGIVGLLTQLPTFKLSQAMVDVLEKEGIDVGEYKLGQKIESSDPAYKILSRGIKEDLAESIMLSFGEMPPSIEGTENADRILKDAMRDVVASSKRTPSRIRSERAQLLKLTGKESVKDIVDEIVERGEAVLNSQQKSYLNKARAIMASIKDGEYTDGTTLEYVSKAYSGERFLEVGNYLPIVRFKEFLNIFDPSFLEESLSERAGDGVDADKQRVHHRVYTDININNRFIQDRRNVIMALNTNLFNMVRSRADQQIFYILNQKHKNLVASAFTHKFFTANSDEESLNKQSRSLIKQQFSIIFNRGMRPPVIALRRSKAGRLLNEYNETSKIFIVSSIPKALGQISSSFLSMQGMYGSLPRRFMDLASAYKEVVGSRAGKAILFGDKYDKISEVLYEHMPDIFFRGVSDFDLNTTMTDFMREAGSLRVWMKGNFRGDANVGRQAQMAPMLLFDRLAARVSAIALYKNFAREAGIEYDLDNIDPLIAEKAQRVTNETQATDNPLYKPATLNNIAISEGTDITELQFGGAMGELWNRTNWAFKSFAMFEMKRLYKARAKILDGIIEGDLSKVDSGAKEFFISYLAKILFQYLKLMGSYPLYSLMSLVTGDDEEELIGLKGELSTNLSRAALDYFSMNPLMQQLSAYTSQQMAKKYLDTNKLPQDLAYSLNVGEYDALGYIGDQLSNLLYKTGNSIELLQKDGIQPEELSAHANAFATLLPVNSSFVW